MTRREVHASAPGPRKSGGFRPGNAGVSPASAPWEPGWRDPRHPRTTPCARHRARGWHAGILPASGTLATTPVLVTALLLAACTAPPPEEPFAASIPESVANWRTIDLSHSYGADTLYWPTDTRGFDLETLAEGETEAGYFYAAKQFATAEHGGTHLDAPVHFAEGGDDVASIALDRLILPGIVVDVSEQAATDADYLVTAEDIGAWEEQHGPVPAGAAVLVRTGWPERWPDALAYLGDDTPGDAGNLHFPGIGEEAARLLIEERGIGLLGIDTASVDYGQSTDFIVHQIGGAAGVPNLENVADLSELPETGFLLVALPMKIEGGTGAPVRIVALVPPQ